ncbi:MAG: hypothetical protein PHW22_01395 [Bacilli bacterium]|nr:hypothetical protein [Bacilli bacterium]
MNGRKKVFIIVASFICLFSLFILGLSIINLAQKQYVTGGFYTLQGLIIMIVISSLIFITSIGLIVLQLKRK